MAPDSSWDTYYSVLAGAAAALAGLVFVVFSRSADKWRGDRLLNTIGLSTVAEFMAPLFVALSHLMPHQGSRYVAIVVGLGGEFLVIAFFYLYGKPDRARTGRLADFLRWQHRLVWVSVVAYGSLIAGGIAAPHVGSYMIAWVSLWLLLSGSVEAWYFMDAGLEAGTSGRHEVVDGPVTERDVYDAQLPAQ